jgi:hypothetical protein
MQSTGWIGLIIGLSMLTAKLEAPPVVLELGPVVPSPAPTPKPAERKRLVSVITVLNSADGESVISFEASDVADEGDGKFRPLASKNYSLVDEEPKARDLRGRILRQVRSLERDMLEYVEIVGPPKERAPLGPAEISPGGQRPYR